MRGELTIVVPMAPPSELLVNRRRNGRSHWSVQSEATKQLRWAGKGAALNSPFADVRIDGPVIVSYDVVWPQERFGARKRIPDHDAIPSAAKAILDGFVDAGILVDDSPDWVCEVRATGRRGAVDEDGCTVVTLVAAGERVEAA